jgi:hypothetical protein
LSKYALKGHAALSGHPARIWDTKRDASQLRTYAKQRISVISRGTKWRE